jgi:hypothetical protein
LEFDFESPVAEDEEAENAERISKATAAKIYIDANFTAESVVDALELPDKLKWEKPEPPPAPPAPAGAPALAPAGDQPKPGKGAVPDGAVTDLARAVLMLAEERAGHRDDDRSPGGRTFRDVWG